MSTKRPPKIITSEADLLSMIARLRGARAARNIHAADLDERASLIYKKYGDALPEGCKPETAQKKLRQAHDMRLKAERLRKIVGNNERRLKYLGQKLSELRTPGMFDGVDSVEVKR